MSMSLTDQDLVAIKRLLDIANQRLETRLIKRIEELDDTLMIQTENGLQAIRDQVGKVQATVDQIKRAQQAEQERNDRQDNGIKRIRKALHAA